MSAVKSSSGVEAGLTALAVSLRGVTKAYDNGVMALGPLDLAVRKGEFISLLGPVRLRQVDGAAADRRAQRAVVRHGAGGAPRGRCAAGHGIGFVFQEPTLMPWTSVRENVRLPLKLAACSEGGGATRAPMRRWPASGLPISPMLSRANCPAA